MLESLRDFGPSILATIAGVAGSALAFMFIQRVLSLAFKIPGLTGAPIPVAHKIAVIGLPGAGKTTLITALFELVQRGVHVDNVRLHGLQTIEMVNRNIARLNSGERIGPTREKDVFVFRFSYIKARQFVTRSYDVEIADFPGEYSERISSLSKRRLTQSNKRRKLSSPSNKSGAFDEITDFNYTLFNKEFFSWIASAREYLFVIDLAGIYSDKNPRREIANIVARIRASWQIIEDAAADRSIGGARDKQVHIVFTKADSLVAAYRAHWTISDLIEGKPHIDDNANHEKRVSIDDVKKDLSEKKSSMELAIPLEESPDLINTIRAENDSLFSDLIVFFRNRVKFVDSIYTSMAISERDGCRLGIRRVLEAVLP
jgi:hypothetical protein